LKSEARAAVWRIGSYAPCVRFRTGTADAAPHSVAVPRFFLHIREAAGLTEDPDGSPVPDLRAACAEAAAAAREIAAEHLRAGKPLNALRFEICDGAGQLLATVPFPKVPGPP
jgi:hypothetical protein